MTATAVKPKSSSGAAVTSLRRRRRPPRLSALGCCVCLGLCSLATVQIMVGLINIGLAPGRPNVHPSYLLDLGAPYWLGALEIVVGIITFLTLCRYTCLIYLSFVANIISAGLGILGIVMYSLDLSSSSFDWMCSSDDCQNLAIIAQAMLKGMDITLIVLLSLQVCANIVCSVLAFMEPFHRKQQTYQPLVNSVLVINPAAGDQPCV